MTFDPMDPEVRAAVFATVTPEEAHGILHSRAGKPWCDALLYDIADEMDKLRDPETESLTVAVVGQTGFRPKRAA